MASDHTDDDGEWRDYWDSPMGRIEAKADAEWRGEPSAPSSAHLARREERLAGGDPDESRRPPAPRTRPLSRHIPAVRVVPSVPSLADVTDQPTDHLSCLPGDSFIDPRLPDLLATLAAMETGGERAPAATGEGRGVAGLEIHYNAFRAGRAWGQRNWRRVLTLARLWELTMPFTRERSRSQAHLDGLDRFAWEVADRLSYVLGYYQGIAVGESQHRAR